MARPQSSREKGFTLIEALVALLVLSVGLLGLSMMQIKSMKSTHISYQRSIATIAAQDMAERLWIEVGRGGSDSTKCPESVAMTTVLNQWHAEWQKKIPTLILDNDSSGGTVVKDGDFACRYIITVEWVDERFGDEDISRVVYVASLLGTAS